MRYTLDELIDDICQQTGLPGDCFQPSCCDHPLCGFHVSALAEPCCGDAAPAPAESCCCGAAPAQAESCCGIIPLPPAPPAPRKGQSAAEENRNYVIRHWQRSPSSEEASGSTPARDVQGLDSFLRLVRTRSFTLTAMAFQDAWDLDIERLHSCSLHVYSEGKVKPFCANYLTPAQEKNEAPAPLR